MLLLLLALVIGPKPENTNGSDSINQKTEKNNIPLNPHNL